ncbi:hypothetical protein OESDEN_25188 [Oesophagostomum dentatum]|uniref:INTS8 TPR repeats domain-containing protein n=1 Tax=Oesophagostomum dentatum TaxID=61180 RepID=A0A0B1RU90_OESDE|nr:hypothetical protein OESDEN_25188 [Oesophagostomum dentatum]
MRSSLTHATRNGYDLQLIFDMVGRGLVGEAGILYIEYLVASRTPLLLTSQENSVEDLIWRRLRVCLSKSYWFTLAALVCQNIEHKREEEYMKAMEFLYSQLSLDAGADYSCMVFDNTLAELLSDVYERNHMQPSADLLVSSFTRYQTCQVCC